MPWRKYFKSDAEYALYYREYRKKMGDKYRGYIREYRRKYRKKYGYQKDRARSLLQRAIIRGEIKRGNCSICDKPNAQGHHNDYTKPYSVKWYCALHHSIYERKNRLVTGG